MAATETEIKQIIVNGSLNPSLTLDELLRRSTEDKQRALWSLKVQAEFAHHYEDVYPEDFEPLKYPLEHKAIMGETRAEVLDEHLRALWGQFEEHAAEMRRRTWDRLRELGREAHKELRRLGISGELRMPLAQLCGYIAAGGRCNDFIPAEVEAALVHIDKTFPRKGCGPNNPNTGRKMHYWTIQSDYIFCHVDFVYEAERARLEAWASQLRLERIKRQAKADNVRLSVRQLEQPEGYPPAFDVSLVLWWD